MNQIESIRDIKTLLKQGFDSWYDLGFVSVREQDNLRLFNYTAKAQFEGRWNYFERVSRGLILDAQTGETVSRPFDKFFNWGERGHISTAPIKIIMEKMDGSLGILYRKNGVYRIATRGSFDSPQALWATDFLNRYKLSGLSDDITLLFEIIYPENRVVIDYQGREDLVLLGARDRFTGKYYPWSFLVTLARKIEFNLPKVFEFRTPEQITLAAQSLDVNAEGWVAEFDDGERFKFKGEEYRKIHKLLSGLSFKKTLLYIQKGTFDEFLTMVPDKYLDEVTGWANQIRTTVSETREQVERVFEQSPRGNRKDFALWIKANNHQPFAPYLFARLDGKLIEPLIYKLAFQAK